MASGFRVALIAGCGFVVVVSAVSRTDVHAAPAAAAVTFTRDVAPILNRNCVSCHRPGEIAPMSLTSFAEARPWARAIRKAVADRVMPPWGADPTHGEFANDPRLSEPDIATLAAWADGGAVEGDSKDLPKVAAQAGGWTIGSPDLTVAMTGDFQVPASGPRIITDVPIDAPAFDEDKYVELMEVVPGNRQVTHHAVVNVVDATGTHRIGGFQPGGATTSYPKGMVRLIPKGAKLTLNMHYNPKGAVATDKTRIAMVFARGPIDKVVLTSVSSTRDLNIPPGEANYEAKGKPFIFEQDSHIVSLLPRMNERGKDFRYTLVYPDGRSEILLSIPKFNDEWQPSYVFKRAIAAPRGSRLETIAHFDNSANNKRNPDPTQRVPFGPEILNGYLDYTVDGSGERGGSEDVGK